ncbi:MAG: hypothetical protein ACOC97_00575 [Myxococcota bacterium]
MRLGWIGLGWIVALPWMVALGCDDPGAAPPIRLDADLPDGGNLPPPRRLEVVSEPMLFLATGEQAEVRAEYTEQDGEPVVGGTLGFAFQGSAHDATLSLVEALTDGEGRAGTTFTAGSTPTAFRVRVSASRATAVFVDVSVSDRGFGDVVAVVEDTVDTRDVERRAVVVFAGVTCADDDLMGRDSDRDPVELPAEGEAEATLEELPAGLDFAVAVRLLGPDGDLLGWGCADAVPVEDDTIEVVLTPEALPLSAGGAYDAVLSLEAPDAWEEAADAVRDAGPGAFPEGVTGALLDAMQQAIAEEDEDLAAAFGQRRESFLLEDDLQAALDAAGDGPAPAAELAAQAAAQALEAGLAVAGPLALDPAEDAIASWHVDELRTGPDGGIAVAADALDPMPEATLEVELQAASDGLQVTQLGVVLPLGSLSFAVVEQLLSEDDAFAEALGCDVVVDWATTNPNVFDLCDTDGDGDADCASAACADVATQLVDALALALAALDDGRAEIGFDVPEDGSLTDEDGDGRVDRVQVPELDGAWSDDGTAPGQPVSGSLDATRTGDLP